METHLCYGDQTELSITSICWSWCYLLVLGWLTRASFLPNIIQVVDDNHHSPYLSFSFTGRIFLQLSFIPFLFFDCHHSHHSFLWIIIAPSYEPGTVLNPLFARWNWILSSHQVEGLHTHLSLRSQTLSRTPSGRARIWHPAWCTTMDKPTLSTFS